MGELSYQFDTLSTREGFNSSLRHFKLVNEIIQIFQDHYNLADILNVFLADKACDIVQIKSIVNALLFDKYAYEYGSFNLTESISDFDFICDTIAKWNAVDIVLVYYHPELGVVLINPKNPEHWKIAQSLKRNELLTIYAGQFAKTEKADKINQLAIDKIIELLSGKKIKAVTALEKGSYKFKAFQSEADQAPVVAEKKTAKKRKTKAKAETQDKNDIADMNLEMGNSKMRMTPMYGITVTNELFHNGNVEAWKKIIASYEHTFPGLKVYVFYDGERINDINTLFKWGKVKRGTAIMISVVGDKITMVAKLKRYLMQGASHRFEAFLKGPPTQLLKLF
ncbi:MAG: hypothetical protein JXR70_07845 [Spirochaetales bacterium]|nr:hypothetical protein [Spirochaetales bacterium]